MAVPYVVLALVTLINWSSQVCLAQEVIPGSGQRDGFEPTGTMQRVSFHSKKSENSDEQIVRHGFLVAYPGAVANVLISHGFMCSKEDVAFLRNLFPRGKFNIMTFDFRAHGEDSKGQFCTFGKEEAYDVMAAAKFIKDQPELQGKPLLVYGFSMGAVSAIEAQAKDGSLFDAMILDCPFDSSENILKYTLSNLKISFFGYQFKVPFQSFIERHGFHPYVQSFVKSMLRAVAMIDQKKVDINICPVSPAESIAKITVPCFFIHCKNDEKVSIAAAKRVFGGANGYKRLWLTNGRQHYDSYFFNPEKYTDMVRVFVDEVLAGTMDYQLHNKIIEDREA